MAYRSRRRRHWNTGPLVHYVNYLPIVAYDKLPQQKEALEARLAQLLQAQSDIKVFSKAVIDSEQTIATICASPSAHRRPSFFSFEKDPLKQPLTQETVSKISALVRDLGALELTLVKKWPIAYPEPKQKALDRFDWSCETETAAQYKLEALRYDVEADIEQCKKYLAYTIRKLEEPARAKASRERKEIEKARRSALLNRQRSTGQEIRLILPRNHPCPYCGGPLGDSSQADHIHPVAKGGLTTRHNMVNVCVTCNNKKSHMTLTAFIAKEGKDLPQILATLRALGKDV